MIIMSALYMWSIMTALGLSSSWLSSMYDHHYCPAYVIHNDWPACMTHHDCPEYIIIMTVVYVWPSLLPRICDPWWLTCMYDPSLLPSKYDPSLLTCKYNTYWVPCKYDPSSMLCKYGHHHWPEFIIIMTVLYVWSIITALHMWSIITALQIRPSWLPCIYDHHDCSLCMIHY